jgi:aminoglycoside phosphotransferase (APT) family kinase protein
MPFRALTPELASRVLRDAGLILGPEELRIEARDERWVVVNLPGERLAWFAASEHARTKLAIERRVLRLLEARCTFPAPRVLLEDAAGDFDVRTMVPGVVDPSRMLAQVRDNVDVAARVGAMLGAILAEQHSRIDASDVAGWLPSQPAWPERREWIRERLVRVVDDSRMIADAEIVLAMYEAIGISNADRVLVHGDLGLHNIAIDPMSHRVTGLFDYEEAAWADRHHDFRYLVWDFDRCELLNAALSVYEPAVGRTIDRGRVVLYNAACAVTFLACRAGTPPAQQSCGRTLAEDLRWSRQAIERALGFKSPVA